MHEAAPADNLLSLGFTPGQLSRLIIEATQDGLLKRSQKTLLLSEYGITQLNAFRARGDLICPDGQWIKVSKDGKLKTTRGSEVYVPRPKK